MALSLMGCALVTAMTDCSVWGESVTWHLQRRDIQSGEVIESPTEIDPQ